MTHKITLLPAQQTFEAEDSESVLEAAIRAGIALDYGCTNGACGLCKARLVSGSVRRTQAIDFPMSEAEKAQEVLLLCAHAAESDLVLEARSAAVQDIPEQNIKVRIRAIDRVEEDVAVLKVRAPRSQRLRFLAGQYASLHATDLPAYETSIASCPCDDLNLEFHIRRVGNEPFSQAVFERFKVGENLELVAPKGNFVLDDGFHGPLLFIAFDTGFSAIKSLLEHATAQNEECPIDLYWIACGRGGQYLDNLCRSWADALDQFRYHPVSIAQEYMELANDRSGARGLVAGYFGEIARDMSERKENGVPVLNQAACYVSAPEPLLAPARTALLEAGLDENRLYLEPVRGNRNASCLLP
jgi:CDP-4-dehydro-6-deoxyglucose reductase, E3